MPKRSPSQQVPKDLQARFDEITHLTDTFSQKYLNDEYAQLCRELTATLCRKRLRHSYEARPLLGRVGSFTRLVW